MTPLKIYWTAFGDLSDPDNLRLVMRGDDYESRDSSHKPGQHFLPAAWLFGMFDGIQNAGFKSNELYAWAVRPGDVVAVPEPRPCCYWVSAWRGWPRCGDAGDPVAITLQRLGMGRGE